MTQIDAYVALALRRAFPNCVHGAGLREYPWIEYRDPVTETLMYRNTETGFVTEKKPADFDRRAKPSARVEVNTSANAVAVVAPQRSKWDATLDALYNTPIIQALVVAKDVVAASPVGKGAAAIKTKVQDVKEDLQEKWETSQHPYVCPVCLLGYSMHHETFFAVNVAMLDGCAASRQNPQGCIVCVATCLRPSYS